jgi:hypothetical protein
LWRKSLSFRACVHRESPLGSVLVEPQDIERAVAARDLAIAVIGAEPLIEDFDELDHASVQTKAPRHGQTMGFAALAHIPLQSGAILRISCVIQTYWCAFEDTLITHETTGKPARGKHGHDAAMLSPKKRQPTVS